MELRLPSGSLNLDRARVMGILDLTPDSFYDQGRYLDPRKAIARAHEMAEEGADIIDVGGEKAGPGPAVSAEEEIGRVVPLIEEIRRTLPVAVSIDTFKPKVALAAMQAGADIINSIGGFGDPEMRRVSYASGAAMVVMHIQGKPRVVHPNPHYRDVVAEVRDFLTERATECRVEGIPADRIIVDPGPGFGKTSAHDLTIIRHLRMFTALPYPVLLAASRKRFIGDTLGTDVDERLEGSLAVVAWSVLQGVRLIRVHDVKASVRVCRMIETVFDPQLALAPDG